MEDGDSRDACQVHPARLEAKFAEFVPTLFARRVPGASKVDTSQINTVQLTLSKFEYDGELNPHFTAGDFELLKSRFALRPSLADLLSIGPVKCVRVKAVWGRSARCKS